LEPPCENCFVELDEENREVVEMYNLVRTQYLLTPMGDVFGLNYAAVKAILDLYEVKNPKQMFEDILLCWKIEQSIPEPVSRSKDKA